MAGKVGRCEQKHSMLVSSTFSKWKSRGQQTGQGSWPVLPASLPHGLQMVPVALLRWYTTFPMCCVLFPWKRVQCLSENCLQNEEPLTLHTAISIPISRSADDSLWSGRAQPTSSYYRGLYSGSWDVPFLTQYPRAWIVTCMLSSPFSQIQLAQALSSHPTEYKLLFTSWLHTYCSCCLEHSSLFFI